MSAFVLLAAKRVDFINVFHYYAKRFDAFLMSISGPKNEKLYDKFTI